MASQDGWEVFHHWNLFSAVHCHHQHVTEPILGYVFMCVYLGLGNLKAGSEEDRSEKRKTKML